MRILIITYEYQNKIAFPNYPDTIKSLNPETWIINYPTLYYELGNKEFHNYIRQLIEKEKIEVLFYFVAIDFEIHVDFLVELRNKVFIAFYCGDDCTYYDMHYKYICQTADYVFTNIIFAEYKYREIGVPSQFLVPAFDINLIKPLNLERNIDVSFIGFMNNRVGRAIYIEYLKQNGISVELWGFGTKNGPASQEKKLEIYNRSKINLDFTGLSEFTVYTIDYPIYKRKKHPKGRSLEIALTRSFLLSEHAPGIEAYLTPKKEIAVFRDQTELLEKVRYFLARPDERERFADAAYERARHDNDLLNQCRMILNILETRLLDRRRNHDPVILGKDYARNYSTYRFFCFLRFMKMAQFQKAFQELGIWVRKPRLNMIQALFFLSTSFSTIDNLRKKLQGLWIKNYKD